MELYSPPYPSVNRTSHRHHVMTAKRRNPDFEKSLAELEQLVEKLERGEQPLEESLRLFERGVQLTRECQKALTDAQARVSVLTQSAEGEAELVEFDADGEQPD